MRPIAVGRPPSNKYRPSHVHPARRTSSHGASLVHFSTAPRLSLSGNLNKPRRPSVVTPSALRESGSPSGDLIVRTTTLATHAHALRVLSRDRSVWAPSVRWDPSPSYASANQICKQGPSGEFYPARSSGLSLYEHARPPSHCARRTTHAHHLIAFATVFAGVTTALGPRHAQFSVVDVRRGSLAVLGTCAILNHLSSSRPRHGTLYFA